MAWFFLRRFAHFVLLIPDTARSAWDYSDWSQHSQGRWLDQILFQWMTFQDVITACSIHRRVIARRKRGKV